MSPLLVSLLNVIGTVVFAISGATLGVRREMDVFGVLVLGCVTATAGGILRDLMLGAVPPVAVADWQPLALAVGAGLATFYFEPWILRMRFPVQVFDAAGLGLFAVAGTQKALLHGVPWVSAAVLGVVSGIGGGIVRDVLTAQVPTVLRAEIYASAALAGSLVIAGAAALGWSTNAAAPVGIALCLFLRLMALYRGWRLPIASKRRLEDRG